jgi:hypothetical protein
LIVNIDSLPHYLYFAVIALAVVGWLALIIFSRSRWANFWFAWIARKAAQIRMPYVYLLPCLLIGFFFIGFGFALFAIIAAIGGGWSVIARFEAQPPTNTEPAAARPAVAAEPA